ncbi:MAG: GNAT family N-acetyltransferase [Myxococcota bacterium]
MTTDAEIEIVASLAREIWNEHFPSIIGQAQVDHMLATIQSAEAIRRQVRDEGYEYDLIVVDEQPVGYVAVTVTSLASAQLSKLYVLGSHRGRGVAKSVIAQLDSRCSARGIEELWLTVNRHNAGPIAAYQRIGFTVSGTIVTDIGEGFVMDDYRMTKPTTS